MGFLDSIGLADFFDGFSLASLGSMALIIFLVFIFAVGAGIFIFIFYYKKMNKAQFKHSIPIFRIVNGKHERFDIDKAKELFIPDTNISLFFLKKRKIYIARPTRSMGKDEYWYGIPENGEWINFDLSTKEEDNTLAIANYDHRDTRYAYVNLKEIIKRNYKDKSTIWWKEYSGAITIIVCGLMFIFAMWFFFWRTGKMLEQMVPISENMKLAADTIAEAIVQSRNINSGILPA